jgi:hypothetical protein
MHIDGWSMQARRHEEGCGGLGMQAVRSTYVQRGVSVEDTRVGRLNTGMQGSGAAAVEACNRGRRAGSRTQFHEHEHSGATGQHGWQPCSSRETR